MSLDSDRYAADIERMNEAQRAHLHRRAEEKQGRRRLAADRYGSRPRRPKPSPSPLLAASIVGGALAAAALVGRRYSPNESHPRTERWYRELDKPGFTPPDSAFGLVWPVLEGFLAVGGYRLLREPPSAARNAAVALWAANVAMIAGWPKLFFGERSPTAGFGAATAQLVAGLAYLEAARRVDGVSAAAGVPYVAWLAFADVIAEEVWRRNA
jgi:benzodiazapine receptor